MNDLERVKDWHEYIGRLLNDDRSDWSERYPYDSLTRAALDLVALINDAKVETEVKVRIKRYESTVGNDPILSRDQ